MTEHKTPTLIMGHIEIMTPDGGEGTPYDMAVIHFEGDEETEIEIYSPEALRLAPFIVRACNSHDALVKALQDICQRANEGRPGEMALIDTIHAMHALARAALTAAGAPHER